MFSVGDIVYSNVRRRSYSFGIITKAHKNGKFSVKLIATMYGEKYHPGKTNNTPDNIVYPITKTPVTPAGTNTACGPVFFITFEGYASAANYSALWKKYTDDLALENVHDLGD